jgi:16S rRNA (guanine1516-N2)-methyltransferase
VSGSTRDVALVRRADGALALCAAGEAAERGVTVEFTTLRRRGGAFGLPKRDPLRRAIGDRARTVADATAGLGRDAFLLAASGFAVTAIERSDIMLALLRDGLARAALDPEVREAIGDRLQLVPGDARAVLPTLAPPDAVYLDPMFPNKSKSALAKKSIRLVRAAVGDDLDAADLFSAARAAARDRVVVKRSDDAPPLAPNPSFSIRGKLVRYDVYLSRR